MPHRRQPSRRMPERASGAIPRLLFRISAALFWSHLLVEPLAAEIPEPTRTPRCQVVDLDVGESTELTLVDGTEVRVRVIDLTEQRDTVREAVRHAEVRVEVNGDVADVASSVYHLPVTVGGVQLDAPITQGRYRGVSGDPWALEKDVRLRFWPADGPWTAAGTFGYPLKQRWFASHTSMANEPIDTGIESGYIYHYDLDFGGAEGLTEIVAATDGLVVSSGESALPGYESSPVKPRYDVVYLLDDRGWFYRYSHFHNIASEVRVGQVVRRGQPLGVLGKEGASGGWSHLHFGIYQRMPSGNYGSIDAYPLVWEAYLRDRQPEVLAVARPLHLVQVGEAAELSGVKSWSESGNIERYEWTFTDGSTALGETVTRRYDRPGRYSEILKVTDDQGRTDIDFVRVFVVDPENRPDAFPGNVHAAYWPTEGIHPGDPVTFLVRSFRTTAGEETIDFGDGTPPVTVRSGAESDNRDPDGYAKAIHTFERPGDYLVRVDREDHHRWPITTHLHVQVVATPE